MTSKQRTLAVTLAGVLLLSSVAAAGTVSSATANIDANSLAVSVEQVGNAGATVTVTHNDSSVENASVTVTVSDENATYAGAGNYTMDENGTVDLPEPEENVTVEVTARTGNATGATTTTLLATEEEDDDGEEESFGNLVSSFVHEMLNAGDDGGPIGQAISEFVTANNPGNASENRPEDAGKPEDAGNASSNKPEDAGNASSGKPVDAGSENDTDGNSSQGPPEQAGNGEQNDSGSGDETTEGDDETTEEDDETTEEDDEKNGNAGQGANNGKGK